MFTPYFPPESLQTPKVMLRSLKQRQQRQKTPRLLLLRQAPHLMTPNLFTKRPGLSLNRLKSRTLPVRHLPEPQRKNLKTIPLRNSFDRAPSASSPRRRRLGSQSPKRYLGLVAVDFISIFPLSESALPDLILLYYKDTRGKEERVFGFELPPRHPKELEANEQQKFWGASQGGERLGQDTWTVTRSGPISTLTTKISLMQWPPVWIIPQTPQISN